jgi:hypothetical protein
MKGKIVTAILAAPFVLGMLALQGCYETDYPAYGYGYTPAPAVYASAPVYVGGWDEHRTWHDRDWSEHHRNWLEHEIHEHDRD